MAKLTLKPKDWQLGDVIKMLDGAYGTGTVIEIGEQEGEPYAKVFRPYMHVSDFSMNGKVIPYIGHEIVTYFHYSTNEYEVVQRPRPGEIR